MEHKSIGMHKHYKKEIKLIQSTWISICIGQRHLVISYHGFLKEKQWKTCTPEHSSTNLRFRGFLKLLWCLFPKAFGFVFGFGFDFVFIFFQEYIACLCPCKPSAYSVSCGKKFHSFSACFVGIHLLLICWTREPTSFVWCPLMLYSKRQGQFHTRHDKPDVTHLPFSLRCFLPVSRILMFSYFSCQ